MRLLDANIFLRYLVPTASAADQAKAQARLALFQRLQGGQETARTIEAISVKSLDRWQPNPVRQAARRKAPASAR